MKAAREAIGVRAGGDAADLFPIAAAAQLACLLEASAPKPGNVSPGRHFRDTRYEHFLASAAAIGGPFAAVASRPLGATIRLAIDATAQFSSANTNLGIVLLLVPLARAAAIARPAWPSAGSDPDDARSWGQTTGQESPLQNLRTNVRLVLEATNVQDARDVYAAIRTASPGGLGEVDDQDVADEPSATLLEVMRLAAGRDGIAREYATGFQVTFECGAPALARARRDGLSWDDAVVETFLTLLAANPDTHVARRGGAKLAADVSRRAAAVLTAGGVRSVDGRRLAAEMDTALRDERNTANPGTSADLTAAAIFVFLLTGGWYAGPPDRGRELA
jgi:triphosphoribosyl-dephospho-CoA synthase